MPQVELRFPNALHEVDTAELVEVVKDLSEVVQNTGRTLTGLEKRKRAAEEVGVGASRWSAEGIPAVSFDAINASIGHASNCVGNKAHFL